MSEENPDMLKRFVIMLTAVVLPVLLLVGATFGATATAQGVDIVTRCPPPQLNFDPIQSGLWAGVNLDTNGLFTTTGTKVIVTKDGTFCSTPSDVANPPVPNFNSSVAAVNTSNSSNPPVSPQPSPAPAPPPTQPLPPTTASSGGSYVAMGDSVAAGVGLPTPIQVPASQVICGRTAEAYPYAVARAQSMPILNVTCSGATVANQFSASSGPFGAGSQLNFAFANGTPGLITITAGANDARWSQLASDCFFSNCATSAETNAANANLVTLQKNLMALFDAIQSKSNNNPPLVVMTGYYNPISLSCTSLSTNITADEVTWMTAEVDALNQTIKGVVDVHPFARFAPIDFTTHDICSSDPWVQGLSTSRPFHPTAQGQNVIAIDVVNTIRK
jgi:lysophospholipase L1-like esterase